MITLFCIRPQGLNIGNEAIHVAVRELVYKSFGRIVNIVPLPACAHYESQARAGLSAQTIYEINRYGDGVIVGGGNLYENGELTVQADALSALEPPMMLFSVSHGRVYNRRLALVNRTDGMPDRTIAALHGSATVSLARDDATFKHLTDVGCDNVLLGGCPTVALNDLADRLPKLPDAENPGVLISVRTPHLMNIPLQLQSQVKSDVSDMIDFLKSENVGRIRLLCHDTRDVEFASGFQATHGVDYVYTSDVYYYLALLKAAKLSISYRLHATLPCFSFGTPSIKISYDERALSLFETLGMDSWNINLVEEHRRGRPLIEAIKERYFDLERLKTLLADRKQDWQALLDVQSAEMMKFARSVREYVDFSRRLVPASS